MKKCGFALKDDYEFWNQNGQSLEAGKLMLVDPFDYDTMQIFFDDSFDE